MPNPSRNMSFDHDARKPNAIDVHIGRQIRLKRTMMGMSQSKIADALDLTCQRVQKYESGANRVGASRLYDLSRILGVPLGFFFDEVTPNVLSADLADTAESRSLPLSDESAERKKDDLFGAPETSEVLRAFGQITDLIVRRNVLELIKTLADSPEQRTDRSTLQPLAPSRGHDSEAA